MAHRKIGFEKKPEVAKPTDDVVTMPMFVPAQMKPGDGVLEMTTRQKFVTEGINVWIDWHANRVLAIVCAVGAMLMLAVNLWLSAGLGAAAGYFYSNHLKTAHRIQLFYKTRRLLYTR